MRYIKYSKIITIGLFSLTLSFVQCSRETSFQLYPCIKGRVTNITNEPIDSARVRLWINSLQSDTLTYFTNSEGIYSTERINNWFNKSITIEASRKYGKYNDPDGYVPAWTLVFPDELNVDSTTSDTIVKDLVLKKLYGASLHSVTPKRLDFTLKGQYSSYFFIINEGSNPLYWEIGENETEWMSFYWDTIYNASDFNHLKRWGYVKFKVNISKLLPPGTYDSSIFVITDQGNTIIPVHVVVE
jgi:hypothetical protein